MSTGVNERRGPACPWGGRGPACPWGGRGPACPWGGRGPACPWGGRGPACPWGDKVVGLKDRSLCSEENLRNSSHFPIATEPCLKLAVILLQGSFA